MKKRSLVKVLSVVTALSMLASPFGVLAAEDAVYEAEGEEAVEEVSSFEENDVEGDGVISWRDRKIVDGFEGCAGYEEGAYAEWLPVAGATGYKAYVKKASDADTAYVQLDDELIRAYSSYWRVDALGLKGDENYLIKIEAVDDNDSIVASGVTASLAVAKHDRSGFGWVGGTASGAYNEDGTLRDNPVVVYITDSNKDTVKATVMVDKTQTECVGLGNIVLGLKKGTETRPVVFRFIGNITDPANLDKGDLCLDVSKTSHGITFEGVGEDAVLNGWGIRLKNAQNVEIRNLAFMNCDSSEGDDVGLQQTNENIWVHHCDMFYGHAGSDKDQIKGDGALDCKKSNHITFSYNHFWDCGKCNLLGLSEGNTDYYITYHHNWYDHSDSRHPRVRYYNAHIYNNYYDGNAKYGMGSTLGSSLFAENNYFRNVKFPMLTSMQGSDLYATGTERNDDNGTFSGEDGGTIKSYNNKFVGVCTFIPYGATSYTLKGVNTEYNLGTPSTKDFDAYVVSQRNEEVPASVVAAQGSKTFDNTKMDVTKLNVDVSAIDDPMDVPAKVKAGAGRVNGGDYWYNFDDEVEDTNYTVINELKEQVTKYKSALVSVGGTVINPVPSVTSDPDKDVVKREAKDATSNTDGNVYDAGAGGSGATGGGGASTHYKSDVFSASKYIEYIVGLSGTVPQGGMAIKDMEGYTSDWDTVTSENGTVFKLSGGRLAGKTGGYVTDRVALAAGQGYMDVTVVEAGILSVAVGSDKDSTTCEFRVTDSAGAVVADANGKESNTVEGKASAAFKYNVQPGTYRVGYISESAAVQIRIDTVKFMVPTEDEEEWKDDEPEPTPVYYSAAVTPATGVSTSYVGGTYQKGDDVEFSAYVNDGYKLAVSVKKADGSSVKVNDEGNGAYSFSMPAADVTVSFEVSAIVYHTVSFKNGEFVAATVKVEDGGKIEESIIPTIAAPSGKKFIGWAVEGGTEENAISSASVATKSVTADVTYFATFADKPAIGGTNVYPYVKGGKTYDDDAFKVVFSKSDMSADNYTAMTVEGTTFSDGMKLNSSASVKFTAKTDIQNIVVLYQPKSGKADGIKLDGTLKDDTANNDQIELGAFEANDSKEYTITYNKEGTVLGLIVYVKGSGETTAYNVNVTTQNAETGLVSGSYDGGTVTFSAKAREGYGGLKVKISVEGVESELTPENGIYSFTLSKDTVVTIAAETTLYSITVNKSNVIVSDDLKTGYYGGSEIIFKVKALKGYTSISVNAVEESGDTKALTGTADTEDPETLVFKYTPAGNAQINISASPIGITDLSVADDEKTYTESDVIEVKLNGSKLLKAVLEPEGANAAVTWEALNPDTAEIISVSGGVVKGLAIGEAQIKVTAGSITRTYKVKVGATDVEAVTIKQGAELSMEVGATKKLNASVSPNNASYKDITWSSDNEEVAAVAADGTVSAKKTGEANITAKAGAAGKEKSATIKITVTAAAGKVPTAVKLNKTEITLTVGGKETLVATIEPEDAADKTVTWTSGDPETASVNAKGEVTGLKVGSTKVTATTVNGKTAEATVNVTASGNPEKAKITIEPTSKALKIGDSVVLKATVTGAEDKAIIWSSSDDKVAKVDESGKVTALAKGSATIKAALKADSSVFAEAQITVTEDAVVEVTGVAIDPASDITLQAGKSVTVKAVVTPEDATDKSVSWSSSDEKVATVKDGVITGVAAGKAVISASASGKSASVNVTVTAADSEATVDIPALVKQALPGTVDQVTGTPVEFSLPNFVYYTGGKITIDDKITMNGKGIGEEVSPGIMIKKIKYKDNVEVGTAHVFVTLKATDKTRKKEVKDWNKAIKSNPFTFEIKPRDLGSVKVDANAIYKAKKQKWSVKATWTLDGKTMKLKYKSNPDKSDFIVDENYNGTAETVTITGRKNFTGTATIPVTIK